MALLERLVGEWPVIAAAPYTHWLLLLAILVAATGAAHFWNRRQIADAHSSAKSAEAHRLFTEAQNKELKEEAEKMAKRIAELEKKPALSSVERIGFTSTLMQATMLEIVRTEQVKFHVPIPEQSEADRTRFALFTRAQELGAARIEATPPSTNTVTAAVSVADLENLLNSLKNQSFRSGE